MAHTHDHSSIDMVGLWGPLLPGDLVPKDGTYPKYERYVEEKMARSLVAAFRARRPARFRAGTIDASETFTSRRGNAEQLAGLDESQQLPYAVVLRRRAAGVPGRGRRRAHDRHRRQLGHARRVDGGRQPVPVVGQPARGARRDGGRVRRRGHLHEWRPRRRRGRGRLVHGPVAARHVRRRALPRRRRWPAAGTAAAERRQRGAARAPATARTPSAGSSDRPRSPRWRGHRGIPTRRWRCWRRTSTSRATTADSSPSPPRAPSTSRRTSASSTCPSRPAS